MTDRDPTDDPEVEREMARHGAFEIAARLYELFEPQTADWLLTVAKIAADRDYRARKANGA